jgi:hypothetical protein
MRDSEYQPRWGYYHSRWNQLRRMRTFCHIVTPKDHDIYEPDSRPQNRRPTFKSKAHQWVRLYQPTPYGASFLNLVGASPRTLTFQNTVFTLEIIRPILLFLLKITHRIRPVVRMRCESSTEVALQLVLQSTIEAKFNIHPLELDMG